MELKMQIGESYLEFCNRVLSNYKQYGFATARDCFKELTGIDMFDNARKWRATFRNIQKAYDSGYYKKFELQVEDVVEVKKEELNSFYKSDELVEVEDLKKELELTFKALEKTEKSLQRKTDENTLLRAEKRNSFRSDNNKNIELEDILKEIRKNKIHKPINTNKNIPIENKSILLTIHDLHYNYTQEEEDSMVNNYIKSVEDNLDGVLPEEIVFAFISDLVNHEKYSKKYTNLYTKGESATKAFEMISRIINHFINNYPSVTYKCCSVVGNESDENEMFMNEPKAGYDNKDYYIYQMLKAKFSDCVEFLNEGNDVVFIGEIRNKTFAINHGYFQTKLSKRNNLEEFFITMQKVILKDYGKLIDFLCVAHIHQPMNVSNRLLRGASWEGENYYSKYALGIADSHRSQNMIVVNDYGWHCRVLEF